jgi:thioredoxin reductase
MKKSNETAVDVVVIGGGPYGLSLAAHLKHLKLKFRIFGKPMHTWATQMPKGMWLKSEGFASSLSDPDGIFTLEDYCKEKNIPYARTGLPVTLELFIAYGLEFQRRFVPEIEDKQVVALRRISIGFEVRLDSGEVITCSRVVVAAGIGHFSYIPPELSEFSDDRITHSSRHSSVDHFKDRDVLVIGAGASALDLCALLHEASARVQLIARAETIRFHDPPKPRSLVDSLRAPLTGIGGGWKLFFYTNVPLLFHRLPQELRLKIVRKTLGPAPGWFIKQQVVGKFPFHLGFEIAKATTANGRIVLELVDKAGTKRSVQGEHVIAATGYRVDLERLAFLQQELLHQIQCIEKSPVLSRNFESSVPGLYFVGTAAANSFGPLMRFAFGADFTAKRLSRHLRWTRKKVLSNDSAQIAVRAENRVENREVLTEAVDSARSV